MLRWPIIFTNSIVQAVRPKAGYVSGEFVTGFDPMTAEAKYRRQLRMKRFGKHEVIENSKFDDKLTSVSDDEAA